jgi:fructoselysine-6-P-deglycase FrlB-like protein
VQRLLGGPVVAVGSGGSLSAAIFAATLHERLGGLPGRAVTPLALRELPRHAPDTSYLLLSASGRHPDVLAAFRELVDREPRHLVVLTTQRDTPLMKLACRYRWVETVQLSLRSGADGFLATNSLLAFATWLARAYSAETGGPELPGNLRATLAPHTFARWRAQSAPLWRRDDIVLLYSMLLTSAAVDLESKFTEAALGHLQTADFRHFAHGRHHWLAKHGQRSAVLALNTEEDQRLSDRTLHLLPNDVPQVALHFGGPLPKAMLAALTASIFLTGERGRRVGIDPGRPGVPRFGSRIYRLTATGSKRASASEGWRRRVLERKAGILGRAPPRAWETALEKFLSAINRSTFYGLVFDYDGTLCDTHERFIGLCPEITSALRTLLSANVPVGIATGRGKSVRKALRSALPRELWPRVLIGYYSGGCVASLTDGRAPQATDDPLVHEIAARLAQQPALAEFKPEIRFCQLGYSPRPGDSLEMLWHEVATALERVKAIGWRAFRSDHSVDVVAAGVSKTEVLRRLRADFNLPIGASILCIGDQAREPGNDAELLAEPFSLSVGSSSARSNAGWNLAPPGLRGVGAVLSYLRALHPRKGTFRFAPKSLMSRTR